MIVELGVCGAAVLAYRLFVVTKRRLLWRVRRRLTLSYIFIGFVPALLIITFFLLCGLPRPPYICIYIDYTVFHHRFT